MRMRIWQSKGPLIIVLILVLLSSVTGCDFGIRQSPPPVKDEKVLETSGQMQCPQGKLLDTPAGYWPLNAQGFKGILQFVGQTDPQNVANPNLAGADLTWSWAQVEPSEGDYDWQQVDSDINVWTSKGKSVILRFSTGGQNRWSGSINGSFTPSWLFGHYGVPRIVETNGTIFPLYWHPRYLQKLADLVHAVANRYDNNPYVIGVEIGVGQGGETEPDGIASDNLNRLQLWQHYGYTNALWWQTIQKIVRIYEQAWKHTPLILMTTSTFLQSPDKLYNRGLVQKYAVSQSLWIQINSLTNQTTLNILQGGTAQLTTTVEEQEQSAKESGYPALYDVQRGIELGARYILVFATDIKNPKNADALAYATQQTTTSVLPDCSGHNLRLSATGRVAPVPGVSSMPNNYSQFFDGSTGTITGTDTPVITVDTWSLEAWLYPTTLPQTEALVVMNGADGGGGFGFGIAGGKTGGTGSHLTAYFPGVGWIDSGYTFPVAREWYHVVVTRDGSTVRFYVNGTQTPNTSALEPDSVSAHFSIGSGYDLKAGVATHFFTGAIEDVAAYTNALTLAQIEKHYASAEK